MADDRWTRIESLFDQALDLEADRVPGWLASLDDDVRAELERLWRAHRAAADFLESPAVAAAAELVAEGHASDLAGAQIGPYRVVREIGRGGMGAVYLAHREDVDLEVAIKRLTHSIASSRAVRALLAERRTLARLEHPHIARLLDAGLAEDGTPYFVMEWVDGVSLTRDCDARRLHVDARLALFLEVCRAIEYAHGRLVVHRDIKPSNILVTGDGVPKLLDFGIAKVLDDTRDRLSTVTLGQFMTPQYASPEQIRGEGIGTASDVYSLGAVLYELLAGRAPHDADTGTPFEVSRRILETEPPPLPEAVPADAAEVASSRRTTPRRLRSQLSGDLATIVAQAMHKDRARRYASVAALADDIERHRTGRPVLARGDSLAYRSERFVRRRWLPLAFAAAAVATGVSFAVFHTRQVATERDRAQIEAQTADAVSEFLVSVFLASDPDEFGGKEPTAQDLLDRGTERIRDELKDEPAVRARVLTALGQVQRKRGRLAEAQPLLEESLAIRRELFGESDPEVIQSLTHVSALRADQKDWAGALALAQEAYDLAAKIHGPDDPETIYRLHNLGTIMNNMGDFERAESVLRRSLDERRRILGNEHLGVAHAVAALANLMRDLERFQEAAGLYREALDLSRAAYGGDHPRVASVLSNLGRMHLELGENEEAEQCASESYRIRQLVYGDDDERTRSSLATLESILTGRIDAPAGETDGAE